MYKVFFNDRVVILTDDFSKNFQHKFGLFFKYREKEDLEEILAIYTKLSRIKSLFIFHYDIEELQEVFRSCFIPIDAAGGLVKNTKGEYLMIYRRGKWDLPKGKLNKGETYQKGALREVTEETGLSGITIKKPLFSTFHTYPYKSGMALKKTYWFEMEYTGSETPVPEAVEDIEEVRWFKPGELALPLSNTYGMIQDLFVYMGLN